MLSRDALHCVLACLELAEKASVLRACRSWRSAAVSEPARALPLPPTPTITLQQVAASPLAKHVATIEFRNPAWVHAGRESLPRLVNLTSLTLNGMWPPPPPVDESLYPNISDNPRVIVRAMPMRGPPYSGDMVDEVVRALLRSAPSLTSVNLAFAGAQEREIDYAPLLELPRLHSLAIQTQTGLITVTVIDVLRKLGGLRSLQVNRGEWSVDDLRALLAPGHALQLEELSLNTLQADHMPLLAKLPTLTALGPRGASGQIDDVGVLEQLATCLPRLAYADWYFGARWPADYVTPPSLPVHAHLQELALRNLKAPASLLDAFLSSCVGLRVLILEQIPTTNSATTLATLSSLPELHTLEVGLVSSTCAHYEPCSVAVGCTMVDNFDDLVVRFESIKKLTSLTINGLASTCLNKTKLDQLCVPSARLPRLIQFATSPQIDEAVIEA